jgi:hypothetical protein
MELQIIQNKIFELRGQKIMLDYDIAEMYEIQTKNLNLAVKRNIERFPLDFMFQLTKDEWNSLRLQIETSNNPLRLQSETLKSKRGGTRYMPYAFTENGVAMLSGVLHSSKAIEVNLSIIRAFIQIRNFALTYKELSDRLKEVEGKFPDIYKALEYLLDTGKQEEIRV